MESASNSVDIKLLSVFSNHLAIKSAGLIEKSLQYTLDEYCRRRSSAFIANFVRKMAERENSLNCEKIRNFLDRFDSSWWSEIQQDLDEPVFVAIDSLKTIRDQIAHGNHNGTGLITIKQYYENVVIFCTTMQKVILK